MHSPDHVSPAGTRLSRSPRPALRPFVRTVWSIDEPAPSPTGSMPAPRERVLPTGAMHVAVRLSGRPLRLIDDAAGAATRTGTAACDRVVGHAVVGGVRVTPYVRDVSGPARSVGAQLLPGASEALFGVPADELAAGHTRLDDLWGASSRALRQRLLEIDSAARRLDIFEAFLALRLPRVNGVHPAVAHALERFAASTDVGSVVRETGYSHRRFIALFLRAVGLTPKRYCRVVRFQGVLDRMAAAPDASLARVAVAAGYSDQSHFSREFRAFAGVTPGAYRATRPARSNHLPIDGSAS